MKKHKIIIFSVLVLLLGGGIALWQKKYTHSVPARLAESDRKPPTIVPTAAQAPPIAAPSQPEPTPSAATPQRKFANMDVLERGEILMEIGKKDLPAIFQAMLDAERLEHDPMKQMGLQTTLASALYQKRPDPEFMEQMRAYVTNISNPEFERGLVFGALGLAATLETVELLADLAMNSKDEKIRYAATGSLGSAGASSGGREKLSPTLERVWRESSDESLLGCASFEMAKIGAPSSIELLLSAALATDGRDKIRVDLAQQALYKIYRRNAVPPLAARLANQPTTNAATKIVVPILVKIGDASAGKAVVNWLQGLDENVAPLIQDLIAQRTRVETMHSAWAAALNAEVPFRNEQNREAIRAGLARYRAGRTSQP